MRIAHLEPCGAPSSYKPCKVEGDNTYSLFFKGKARRILIHGCMHALDVYLCMHELRESTNNLLIEPPKPDADLLPWLEEHCGGESREGYFKDIILDAFGAIGVTNSNNTASSASICELGSDAVLNRSQLLPSIGRYVQLEVPRHLTGEKIEIPPSTARDDLTLMTLDDYGRDNSPPHTRRLSIQSMLSRRLSDEPETQVKEEGVGKNGEKQGASLWWRLREEALKDKAKASGMHFTKREPFKYKSQNKGSLM